MSVDRKRFEETLNKKKEERKMGDVMHLVHAAVPILALTQSHEWNHFLQLIEGLIEAEQSKYEPLSKQLSDPKTVNTDQIMLLKAQINVCLSRINTLIEVRDLPRDILEAADKAKKII